MGRGWAPEEHEISDLKPGKNPAQKFSLNRQQARLKINTDPPGAQVYVDGKLWGPAPQEKYVQSGSHKVRLEKEGYKPDEFPITLNTNSEKTRTLARIPGGKIQLSAFPGAEVQVDDKLVGTVNPVINYDVDEGWHDIRFVSLDKKKTLTHRVQIKAGDWIRLHADMESGRITPKSLK
jgi:hypothetical protein